MEHALNPLLSPHLEQFLVHLGHLSKFLCFGLVPFGVLATDAGVFSGRSLALLTFIGRSCHSFGSRRFFFAVLSDLIWLFFEFKRAILRGSRRFSMLTLENRATRLR